MIGSTNSDDDFEDDNDEEEEEEEVEDEDEDEVEEASSFAWSPMLSSSGSYKAATSFKLEFCVDKLDAPSICSPRLTSIVSVGLLSIDDCDSGDVTGENSGDDSVDISVEQRVDGNDDDNSDWFASLITTSFELEDFSADAAMSFELKKDNDLSKST